MPAALVPQGCTPTPPASFGESAGSRTVQCVHLARHQRVLVGDTVTTSGAAVTIGSAITDRIPRTCA